MVSVAAANPSRHGTTPAVLFHDCDIAAGFFVGTITPLVAPGITPPLLVCTFGLAALAPPLTFLLLRITNANLRATVGANAKLNGRLSQRGCADKKTGANCGRSQKGKFSHRFNPLANRNVTSDDQGGSNP